MTKHDEIPFWDDEMPFWDDEIIFSQLLKREILSDFLVFAAVYLSKNDNVF
jgi:hypothetical protein